MAAYAGVDSFNDAFLADEGASIGLSTPPTDVEADGLSAEQLEQLWTWNSPLPPTLATCMHDIIREQAQKQPQQIAIESWDGRFTYRDVDSLSDLFATKLVALGMLPGAVVPLCFEKSRWTAIAVLAVMKAGATFALTDPSQPEGRLRTIVEQTGATVLVTSRLQEDLGCRIAPKATRLTLTQQLLDEVQTPSALPTVPPSTNLYIQFTSGSTGKPKGVIISHVNYTSGAIPRAEAVGYKAHSRVLDFASYAFDVCIDCMLCTLSVGGCLCIPSDADRVNDLSGAIRKMHVNMAHMTPSVARVLDPDIIPSLEVLGLGGEAISAGDSAVWSKTTKVVNAYGPSECTVGCTVNSDVGAESHKPHISIGRGVGAATWIVEPTDHNHLMAIGEVGELLIEGPIVGPGYLAEPEKTTAVFVNNPKWLLAGGPKYPGREGRLYKTGDLVRYDTDGTIIFVGRADQQVKLRGQRIELAEIEYNMRDKLPPGTRIAIEVIKPAGSSGEPSLVAFISDKAGLVSESESLLGTHSSQVRDALTTMNSRLSHDLPIYMIPAVYIPLSTMPLLVSAKTDRKRLREIGSSLSRKDIAGYAAAATPRRELSTTMELELAEAWRKVLGTDMDLSASDNFFTIGGDSLRAMKLVAEARARDISLTVAGIFSNPVLSEMALVAKAGVKHGATEIAPFSLLDAQWTEDAARAQCAAFCGVDAHEIEDIYPCTPLQEGLMALSAKISEAYVAQRVIELESGTAAQDLLQAFRSASVDCPILRTRIVQVPEHGLMQVVVKDDFTYEATPGRSLNKYLEDDMKIAVGLGKALVRYGVICSEESQGKAYFILTMHHALYDGWSMPLVVDRVNAAYDGKSIERPAQFKHFIKYLLEMDRKESEEYWRERLAGATGEQFPALPWPGYQQQADSLLEHYVPTGKITTGMTVATIIRGAWAFLVSRYTASEDVVFGETLTGRNAPIPGVEEIEGPMIATVPVRVAVDPDVTVEEYLREIHDQSVTAIPHEHFGLQHIRRLSPDTREACELRTGIVMHPSTESEDIGQKERGPADGFVPAGDTEAAQEALKFNTYALMLVCSLDPQGFLIMASFDSKTVSMPQMKKILIQLEQITRQLIENPSLSCSKLDMVVNEDINELVQLSRTGGSSLAGSPLSISESAITETWIVDPFQLQHLVPVGAVGELLVRSKDSLSMEQVRNPERISEFLDGVLYRTTQMAKYTDDGKIIIVDKSRGQASAPSFKQKRVAVNSTKQKILRQVWSRMLSISEEEIGLNDSFFQLGGDSIGSMKVVSELRAKGMELTVPEIFKHRTLYEMAKAVKERDAPASEVIPLNSTPFSLLDVDDAKAFIAENVQPMLFQENLKILDVLPTRPLQQVAVKGTTELPRYSARYELFHLSGPVDTTRLFQSCHDLVAKNEILRTVFVEAASKCYGVVLEALPVAIDQYDIAGDISSFVHKLCDLDIQTRMPLGSPFVKFFFVRGEGDSSCLIIRISHAQYDEICLTGLLRQLAALYDSQPTRNSAPFSSFVYYAVQKGIPQSIPYWRDLLEGSALTVLRPDLPLTSKTPAALTRTVDIAARLKDITIATLPTAAWALCLARRLGLRDVVFGEVVSGRNIDLPNADAVMGPTWQYVPVRVKFEDGWTGLDLLEHVQYQHIASAQHECMGLTEIVRDCTEWPASVDWFDSVVHQDVYHVEELTFGAAECRLETVYPHLEPLREWKVQAFVKGDSLTLEIVTFKDWIGVAGELLDELEGIMTALVRRPGELLF
ncbi:peptide synthetase [Xylaria bambusicola]|uniref:peptide synthetase n=1 Tax=Xylaria bambusicola TaxID=326684 RepID=UPI002008BEE2|nr:peptide synthetase [Xylaria bambusicola]KAI0508854.1 peptide synthetase [Xylaria bambusicola]